MDVIVAGGGAGSGGSVIAGGVCVDVVLSGRIDNLEHCSGELRSKNKR